MATECLNRTILTWLCLIALSLGDSFGQTEYDYEYLKEKYSSENTVVLTSRKEISVIRKKKKIVIVEKVFLEKLMTGKNKDEAQLDIIPFSTFASISSIEAYTLVPDKNGWKKHMAWNFRDMLHVGSYLYNDNYLKIIKFPAVEQGCRTIISYTKTYTEPYLWGGHFLSNGETVLNGEITLKAPKSITFNIKTHNFRQDSLLFELESKGSWNMFNWQYKTEKTKKPDDQPLFFSGPMLLMNIARDTDKKHGQYYLESNKYLANWYFHNFLKAKNQRDTVMEEIADSITNGLNYTGEIAMTMTNWVSKNINYIAIEDGYNGIIPRSSNYVLKQRYGDCKDKSNLLIEMLKHKNIRAYPVFVGTTSLPFSHDSIVSPIVDNHVIVAIDTGKNNILFVDPTQEYQIEGLPPFLVQGKTALVLTDSMDYFIEHFPTPDPELSKLTMTNEIFIEGPTLFQQTDLTANGYFMVFINPMLTDRPEDKIKGDCEFISFPESKTQIPDSLSDLELNPDSAFVSFTIFSHQANPLQKTNSGIFINPYPNGFFTLKSFQELEEKKQSVFHFPATWESITTLHLENDYHVKYLPQNILIDSLHYSFSLDHSKEESDVVIHCILRINKLYFTDSELDGLASFFADIRRAFNQNIIITPKN